LSEISIVLLHQKSCLVYHQNLTCTNWCTKRKLCQSAPNVPKLTRNDAYCRPTEHWSYLQCTKCSWWTKR